MRLAKESFVGKVMEQKRHGVHYLNCKWSEANVRQDRVPR